MGTIPYVNRELSVITLFTHTPKIQPRQLLLSSEASRLLLSAPEKDILLKLSREHVEEVNSCSWPERRRFRWMNHPTASDRLIVMLDCVAHMFPWDDLKRLTGKPGIQLASSILPELAINSMVSYLGGSIRVHYRHPSK